MTTAASGPLFHWYFLISIISAGLLLTVFYIILICRLFVIKGYHAPLNRSVNKQAAEAYRQVLLLLSRGMEEIERLGKLSHCCCYSHRFIVFRFAVFTLLT